jgi:hypothetical protein
MAGEADALGCILAAIAPEKFTGLESSIAF